jgi:hypothetical protein
MFLPRLPDGISLEDLGARCKFLNSKEIYDAGFWFGQVRSPLPVVQLKLTLDSFNVDCFCWETRILVSRRLRDAMALDPSAVQYFDVDASQSAPGPRAMDYKVMNVTVTEEVADREASSFRTGSLIPGGQPMVLDLQSMAFRRDVQPKQSLFYEKFFVGRLLCADDLALRVLRAECTGVQFLDTAQLHLAGTIRYRTAQGVEEAIRDREADIMRTRLVEELD